MKTTPKTSLLDTADCLVAEWFVVYHYRDWTRWFFRGLKRGFQHVELTKRIAYGPDVNDVVWLNVLPQFEMLDVELSMDPTPPWTRCPQSTVQKVTAIRPRGKVRQWFHIGPVSCVETVKNALGINKFWVRTPWQLYKYIAARNGVIDD